jgi:hypothetical protein
LWANRRGLYRSEALALWHTFDLFAARWLVVIHGLVPLQGLYISSPFRHELFFFVCDAWYDETETRDRLELVQADLRLHTVRFAAYYVPGFAVENLAGDFWSDMPDIARFVALRLPGV